MQIRTMRDLRREKLLTVMTTRAYTRFEPQELVQLYNELLMRMGKLERSSEPNDVSLLEMYFYVCCYLGKDQEMSLVFQRLRDRFGESSPRVAVMKATMMEVEGNDSSAAKQYLEGRLKELEYDADSVSYVMLSKKLLALKMRDLKKNPQQQLKETLALIEKFPLDPELQWVCSELYYSLKDLDKAIYCIEEVLVAMPFNYVAFARLSELLYYKYVREFQDKPAKRRDTAALQQALDNALRSVELSELFLKGWSLVATISKELDKPQLLQLSKKKLQEISEVSNSNDARIAKKFLQKMA